MALLARLGFILFEQKSRLTRRFLTLRTRTCFLLLLVLILNLFGPQTAQAQSDSTREYQIKAAFLYNFIQFVKWPGTTFPSSDAPFCIGILGDDPFGSALDDTIQGEAINGHRLIVMRSPRIEELMECQMIFVCRSEAGHVDAILSQLSSKPILTVSEVPDFASAGGDIDFYLSNDKVRFEINPQAVRQGGLKMSSQLLALGKIVEP
jgi:hypothetical protein